MALLERRGQADRKGLYGMKLTDSNEDDRTLRQWWPGAVPHSHSQVGTIITISGSEGVLTLSEL